MQEGKEIEMVYEYLTDSPVKSACMMADGVHVCTGSFDGSLFMWNIQVKPTTKNPSYIHLLIFFLLVL